MLLDSVVDTDGELTNNLEILGKIVNKDVLFVENLLFLSLEVSVVHDLAPSVMTCPCCPHRIRIFVRSLRESFLSVAFERG